MQYLVVSVNGKGERWERTFTTPNQHETTELARRATRAKSSIKGLLQVLGPGSREMRIDVPI